ncbi:hypothetical protein Tco_0485054 [Tanacetum coccineum]
MASNKDQIENLEAALRKLKDGITEMKIGFADKFQHLEDIVTKLSDAVLSGKGGDNYKEAGSKPMVAVVYQEEGKEVTWEIFYEEVQRIMRTLMKLFQGVGHKCKGPQLLVMESALDESGCESFVYLNLEVKVLLKRKVMMSQNEVMKAMTCLHDI